MPVAGSVHHCFGEKALRHGSKTPIALQTHDGHQRKHTQQGENAMRQNYIHARHLAGGFPLHRITPG